MHPLIRRYTFKLYPAPIVLRGLDEMRGLHSRLYNALNEQRIDAWHRGDAYARIFMRGDAPHPRGKDGGVVLTAFDQGHELTRLRAEMAEYRALDRGSMEQTVKRLDLAWQQYFRFVAEWRKGRTRNGIPINKPPDPPRFRRLDGFGMREMKRGGWSFDGQWLRINGLPRTIRARGEFPQQPEDIRTCELWEEGGTWWLSVVVLTPPRMRREAERAGTLQFGLLNEFARLGPAPERVFYAARDRIVTADEANAARDDGQHEQARLKELQEAMARCKRGSHRYRKLRQLRARLMARIARRRREKLHVWTTALAREHASLAIHSPPLAEATQSGHGNKSDPGARTAEKAALNRLILDQSPGSAIAMLQYKLAERGGNVELHRDHRAAVMDGNALVTAAKENRKLKRAIKHASRSGRGDHHGKGGTGLGSERPERNNGGAQAPSNRGQRGGGQQPHADLGARD